MFYPVTLANGLPGGVGGEFIAGRRPIIVILMDGKPVSAGFYSVLISATLVDNEGDEVDRLTIEIDDAGNQIERPRKGGTITCQMGYLETGLVDKGRFKVENVTEQGSVDRGQTLTIEAHAEDLRKDAKAAGQKAYEEKTFREIVDEEARAMGLEAVVAPELASQRFDWRVRWNASRLDFLTRLADEIGGIVKPAGGKLIVQKRGSGKSASGQDLPQLIIRRSDCSEWSGKPVGRMEYGQVVAYWTDPATGKQLRVKTPTERKGPDFTIREPFPDEKAARRAAEAQVGKLNRGTGSASFTLYGNPAAAAGQKALAVGFSSSLAGEWVTATVTHTFKAGPSGGYTTEIEVKAPESGRKDE
jgi:phage protein D